MSKACSPQLDHRQIQDHLCHRVVGVDLDDVEWVQRSKPLVDQVVGAEVEIDLLDQQAHRVMPLQDQVEIHDQEIAPEELMLLLVVVNQVAVVLEVVFGVQVDVDLDVVVNQIEQRVDHVQECWAQCQDEVVRRWAPPHQFQSLVCLALPLL